jgi:Leucine-rich repeat (LRR) protein
MKRKIFVCGAVLILVGNALGASFDNLTQALKSPEKVTQLTIRDDPNLKHLPPKFSSLINLKELNISCLELLEELPADIGRLTKLEKIVIDNGNGCGMNITIPASIGELRSLKVLKLFGAFDPGGQPEALSKVKSLPTTIANLHNLEELDLGRNRLESVPAEIGGLKNLKKLVLDYNEIHETPASIGELSNLKELSVCSNGGIKLPESLSKISGLKIAMGNNHLKLKDQEELRRRFPKAAFDFTNEYDDDAANEEPGN